MALSNYKGEEIIDSILIKQGKKFYDLKWMPRTVFNDPQNKDAYIIGNGESRTQFDLYSLPQDTYGCNALYRDYEPDYLITIDQHMYKEIIESEYADKNIVYTHRDNIRRHGDQGHLIPANPSQGAGTTAMHIAIHDGHKNLYCLGFDCAHSGQNNNVYKNTSGYRSSDTQVDQSVWAEQIYILMTNNKHVKFTYVEGTIPNKFLELSNCTQIDYVQLSDHINTKNETA